MCLDIAFYSALELIDNYFPDISHEGEMEWDEDLAVHVMALGHKRYPVILQDEHQHYSRHLFEWGIIAGYMNTPEKIKLYRKNMVNARSEKIVDDKNSYWRRIRKQRCLVPVTGFYEHREVPGLKNKIPYHIRLKNRQMFCLPALYHYNQQIPNPETGELRGMFTLVTRAANSVMRQIHNSGDNAYRMPLLLTEELEKRWLNPQLSDAELKELLEFEMPENAIDFWPVFSIRGRKPRPDGKIKNERFDYENLPEITV